MFLTNHLVINWSLSVGAKKHFPEQVESTLALKYVHHHNGKKMDSFTFFNEDYKISTTVATHSVHTKNNISTYEPPLPDVPN